MGQLSVRKGRAFLFPNFPSCSSLLVVAHEIINCQILHKNVVISSFFIMSNLEKTEG